MTEPGQLPQNPECPHCESDQTHLMSPFGTVLANAQYYCNGCKTVFELMKNQGSSPSSDE